ncbi:nucleotide disphospho-sugar-binding domain-containing protein [Paraburkholderia sp. IW21]|uniref:nucleotide disphospho-sugar-binding domain-containing protein n=1 Tax=Paraburkholderia sp. IW21 TaxID=3242488 RepID=UPI003521BE85
MKFSEAQPEFLFTVWEGGGAIPPALGTARRLLGTGARVRVMSDACNREEVERQGLEFIAWSRATSRPNKSPDTDPIRDWEITQPLQIIDRLCERLIFGPAVAYAQDTLDEVARRPADVVVTSELLFGPMMAAEVAGCKLALLTANLWLYPTLRGVPPAGPGFAPATCEAERERDLEVRRTTTGVFDAYLPVLNRARKTLSLAPLNSIFDQLNRADCTLLGTSAAFDFSVEELPESFHYVGPQLDEPGWVDAWESPWPAADSRPLVLVAFSTTFQNQGTTLQRVIDALTSLPVRGVVTLGEGFDGTGVRCTEKVVVRRSAPHDELMQRASLVVTHGGHGTVMRALSAGVPMLCLPMGRDQRDNAARVTIRGAGLMLEPSASTNEIASAVEQLLSAPAFRLASGKLGTRIRAESDGKLAAQTLYALARRSLLTPTTH